MKRAEANLWRQEGGTKPWRLVAVADARAYLAGHMRV